MAHRLARLAVTLLPVAVLGGLFIADGVDVSTADTAVAAWFERNRHDLLAAGLWLAAAWTISRILRHHVWHRIAARREGPAPKVLAQISTGFVYAVAFGGILGSLFGKDLLAGLAAFSGVIGIVLGFALRSIILDLFMGLAINLERPFRIGDRIHVKIRGAEVLGTVQEITWRAVRVLTSENTVAIIPNREISDAVVVNMALPQPPSLTVVEVPVESGVSPARASRVLEAALREAASRGGPVGEPVRVEAGSVTGDGVTWRCVFMHDHRRSPLGVARDIVLRTVLRHLYAAGIELATSRRIVLDGDGLRPVEGAFAVLRRVPLFEPLTDAELETLSARVERHHFAPAETVVRQGDAGDVLHVVVEGFLEALVDGRVVGTVTPGDLIGEMAMLTGEVRSATVRAVTDCIAWEVRRDALAPLLEARPALFEAISDIAALRRRRLLAAMGAPVDGAPPPTAQAQSIRAAMARVFGMLKLVK